MNEIVNLKPSPKASKPIKQETARSPKALEPVRSAKLQVKLARQRTTAYGTAGVALVLMALSLTHLADGIEALTHSGPWQSRMMAVGIDLGFIALELAQLCTSTDTLRKSIMRWAGPTIIGTLVVSAAMNAYAFASTAKDLVVISAACVLGVSIPMLVYVLTRVSVALWIDANR